LAEHVTPKKGVAYWLISSETIEQIPQLAKAARGSLLNNYLPQSLIDNQIEGVPLGHWLAIIVIALGSYALIWAISTLLITLTCYIRGRFAEKSSDRQIIHAFTKPLQLFFAVAVSFFIIRFLGLSLLARQTFMQLAQVAIWVSFAWMIWNLIDAFSNILKQRLMARGQYSVLSAVVFLRRSVKFALLVIVAITVLDNFGFQVTTWLAALGIGGIALALGAQKTVENFVGSLTLVADRPIAIGDFCKFGNTTGWVEDIGMRSTRVRTKDRTIVTIPNGDFASMQIENYTKRDDFFYNPILGLRYETTPDQLRYLLIELRAMLYAHPKVINHTMRVNFTELAAHALNIEVGSYIKAGNNDEATDIKEDLNLRIMDIVAKSGTGFAFPSQTIYLAKDSPLDKERAEAAEKQFRQWKKEGKFQLPDFTEDEIKGLEGSISYPLKKI
jgi:MscS family membrane protein